MSTPRDLKTVRTVCPYCGVGCGMELQVDGGKVVKVSGDKKHPTNFGRLCTKGSTAAQALRDSGRLDAAYLRRERHGEPTRLAMDAAITETARRLRAILDAHGPDALSFYVSGQMSLEAQYLINKLAKGYVGTNNIDSNSRLCMSSAASGYKLSLGADGPPGSYQDMDRANLFFVSGANMADCHPILFLRVMDRVKQGAKLIVVDPRRNTTAEKADLFLQIRPGSDLALLNGLLHLLVENGHVDPAFIAEFTEGWDAMPAFLADYPPARVAGLTGLAEADIRKAAQWIGEAGQSDHGWMSCWTMGLNQSTHGTWNTNAICNLHLATGAICRPGSGPFSLTGQPNAMGGREVGYLSLGLPGQRAVVSEADRQFIEQLWEVPAGTIQPKPGPDTVTMFKRMAEGSIRACWIICTNPVASVANRDSVIAGLQKAELVVTQDAFLDTETNRYADILLPGALWAEAEGVMINSERNLTLMQQAIEPPGEALADWRIIARVACEMGFADGFGYANASEIFDEIRQTWNPKTGYDIRGISHGKLRETPVQWPCPPDAQQDRNPIRYLNDGTSQTLKTLEDGSAPRLVFPTPSGKAQFIGRPHLDPAELPDEGFPFILNTGRLPHQWHTMTKTGKIATLNKLNPRPFVEIHPEDAQSLGIKDGDKVEVRSRRGRAVLPAVVTDRVLPGNGFSPFHWNDVFGEALAINAVTNDAVDPLSLQPEFKFCAVALARVASEDAPATLFDDLQTMRDALGTALATTAPAGTQAVAARAATPLDARIDALTAMLQLPGSPPPVFSDEERLYLGGFFAGVRERRDGGMPTLPANAPVDQARRLWLNGLLAGWFGAADAPA
ncbi:MAG: bifunctional nitrate reductase/sulfite reductase flavoprotein subunit alpha, partial [Solimonas sp.]